MTTEIDRDKIHLDTSLLEVTRLLLPEKVHQLSPPSPAPGATVISFDAYASARLQKKESSS